jgi:hypothetical protein
VNFETPVTVLERTTTSMSDMPGPGITMERVDSGMTDDSPFASSLTTPVDEEVPRLQLFSSSGHPSHRRGWDNTGRKFGMGVGMGMGMGMGIEERLRRNFKLEGEYHDGGSYVGLGALEEPAIVSEEGLFKQELEKKVRCWFITEGLTS